MTVFLLFLIGLILWFVLRPAYLLRRRYKQMQDEINRTFGGFGGRQQQQPRQSHNQKKKIDPSVGEYVEFTETTTTTRTTADNGTTSTTVETEEQVEDVRWEDLP